MASCLRPGRPFHHDLQCLSHQLRQFSLTPSCHAHKQALANSHAKLPDYPYGPSHWYKQSNFGLYGGLKISSGNNVSSKLELKTRRKWRPNIQMKRLYSHALNRHVRVKVATRVLRTIDKSGGLDEYLVGDKPARVKELGMKGWALRCQVMGSTWWQERKVAERERLGLSPLRKYHPSEKEDLRGEELLVGMHGEVVREATNAYIQEMKKLREAAQDYDKDGNPIGRPDLIAYDEEISEGDLVSAGKYVVEPKEAYMSGLHKRRALVKEVKAKSAQARAVARANKLSGKGIVHEQPLRADDLRQHLVYQKRKDDLATASNILAMADAHSPLVDSRPTL